MIDPQTRILRIQRVKAVDHDDALGANLTLHLVAGVNRDIPRLSTTDT